MVFSSGSVAQIVGEIIDKYTIVMWYGTLASIPAGWQICDGTNGTPDMRGYFPRGAAAGNAGDNTAHGAETHLHTNDITNGVNSASGTGATRTASHTHLMDSVNHLPPYKHVVFIMKL